jgi:hypothetical protein
LAKFSSDQTCRLRLKNGGNWANIDFDFASHWTSPSSGNWQELLKTEVVWAQNHLQSILIYYYQAIQLLKNGSHWPLSMIYHSLVSELNLSDMAGQKDQYHGNT